jgi:hypothetical protein
VKAFVRQVRRSGQRYAGQDADPDVVYERMPHVHFAIDGTYALVVVCGWLVATARVPAVDCVFLVWKTTPARHVIS